MGLLFRIDCNDNNSYMLGEETISREKLSEEQQKHYDWRFAENEKIHSAVCEICGSKKEEYYINSNFKLRRKVYDISSTYDGHIIVSEKFRTFCIRKNYHGIEFIQIKKGVPFYVFVINNILELDEENMKIRKSNFCNLCNEYSSIVGPNPLKFKNNLVELEKTFYISDIKFGSAHEKQSIMFINDEIIKELEIEKIRGYSIHKLNR